MSALKSIIIFPTIEEDAMITAAALSDTDSMPLTDSEWSRVRPKQENQIAVKLSANVVAAFKATGEDWQHKITVLQDWLRTNVA